MRTMRLQAAGTLPSTGPFRAEETQSRRAPGDDDCSEPAERRLCSESEKHRIDLASPRSLGGGYAQQEGGTRARSPDLPVSVPEGRRGWLPSGRSGARSSRVWLAAAGGAVNAHRANFRDPLWPCGV